MTPPKRRTLFEDPSPQPAPSLRAAPAAGRSTRPVSAWLLIFYQRVPFLTLTGPPKDPAQAGAAELA